METEGERVYGEVGMNCGRVVRIVKDINFFNYLNIS